MRDIEPNETEIKGQWVLEGGKMQPDQSCERIEWLLKNRLTKHGASEEWEALYSDPSDERFWLLTYPESHMHGGGPPLLKFVAKSEAALWQLRQAGQD